MNNWINWKFFKWGFFGNTWVWFHMLGGAVYANIARRWLTKVETLVSLFILTVAWEVIEFFSGGGVDGMIVIYGSLERWAYDSLGDIVGAMITALLVVL
jgi:hypothetical protein